MDSKTLHENLDKLIALHHGIGVVGVLVVDGDGEIGVQADGGDSYDVISLGIKGRVKEGTEEIGDVVLEDLKDKIIASTPAPAPSK